MTESESPWALHQALTNSFLDLARAQYTSRGEVDPDVQVGLGTAYYMMGEYEEARKCWVAALGERPDVSAHFLSTKAGV
jgi:peroxin-5